MTMENVLLLVVVVVMMLVMLAIMVKVFFVFSHVQLCPVVIMMSES